MCELTDAAFNVVHDYPGGAAALGVRMGKSPTTLSHEVRGAGFAKLGLSDAGRITVMTGDSRIVNALCAMAGGMFLPLPAQADSAPEAIQHLSVLAKEFADVVREVSSDVADGTVTLNELQRIQREWGELVVAGQQMVSAIRAMHEAQVQR